MPVLQFIRKCGITPIAGINALMDASLRTSCCFSTGISVFNTAGATEPPKRVRIRKANKMPPRPKVSELEIEEKFIKGGSGNGGQKINKTNSKVQLKHIPTGIVVTSQATRSRDQNRKIAREILAMKLDEMEKGKESRAQLLMARKQMVKRRSKKKSKAKYRKLEEEKKAESESNVKTEQETTIVDEDEDIIVVK